MLNAHQNRLKRLPGVAILLGPLQWSFPAKIGVRHGEPKRSLCRISKHISYPLHQPTIVCELLG